MSIEIIDSGFIVFVRDFSNTSSIVKILSKNEGLLTTFIKGGSVGKISSILQVGNFIDFKITKRLEENLGTCQILDSKCFGSILCLKRETNYATMAIAEAILLSCEESDPVLELFNKLSLVLNQLLLANCNVKSEVKSFILFAQKTLGTRYSSSGNPLDCFCNVAKTKGIKISYLEKFAA